MIRALAPAAGVALCAAAPAGAATLDRVRGNGVVRCGGVIRPGLAFPAADQTWQGLEVDMCRAVAAAVLGADAKIEFHSYLTDKDFARLAAGADDLAFLTGSEIHANGMFGAVLPGPAVFYETTRLMVQEDNPAADLAGVQQTSRPSSPRTRRTTLGAGIRTATTPSRTCRRRTASTSCRTPATSATTTGRSTSATSPTTRR